MTEEEELVAEAAALARDVEHEFHRVDVRLTDALAEATVGWFFATSMFVWLAMTAWSMGAGGIKYLLTLGVTFGAFRLSKSLIRFWAQVGTMKRRADRRRKDKGHPNTLVEPSSPMPRPDPPERKRKR